MVRIAVVDGQGGGIGKSIVEKLCKELSGDIRILALGTNAMATAAMLKAGAHEGATGENAIVVNVNKVDIVVGTIAILAADSMLGELTPRMAEAIGSCSARKVLIPLNRCNLEIVGVGNVPLPTLVDLVVSRVKDASGNNAC